MAQHIPTNLNTAIRIESASFLQKYPTARKIHVNPHMAFPISKNHIDGTRRSFLFAVCSFLLTVNQ